MNDKLVYLVYGEDELEKKIPFNSVIENIEEAICFLNRHGSMILKEKKYYELHFKNERYCFVYRDKKIKQVNL